MKHWSHTLLPTRRNGNIVVLIILYCLQQAIDAAAPALTELRVELSWFLGTGMLSHSHEDNVFRVRPNLLWWPWQLQNTNLLCSIIFVNDFKVACTIIPLNKLIDIPTLYVNDYILTLLVLQYPLPCTHISKYLILKKLGRYSNLYFFQSFGID